jgi:hypothetical protein
MKRAALIGAAAFLLAAIASGQQTEKKPDVRKPISALRGLVGGVWTADSTGPSVTAFCASMYHMARDFCAGFQ